MEIKRQCDLTVKRIINDPVPSCEIREGYYTLDEFRKIAIEKGHFFCDKHGIN